MRSHRSWSHWTSIRSLIRPINCHHGWPLGMRSTVNIRRSSIWWQQRAVMNINWHFPCRHLSSSCTLRPNLCEQALTESNYAKHKLAKGCLKIMSQPTSPLLTLLGNEKQAENKQMLSTDIQSHRLQLTLVQGSGKRKFRKRAGGRRAGPTTLIIAGQCARTKLLFY